MANGQFGGIQGCWFRGGNGTGIVIHATGYVTGQCDDNTIEGYDTGPYIYGIEDYVVRDNRVSQCTAAGIEINGSGVIAVHNNNVRNCPYGIIAYCDYIYATGNTVISSNNWGLRLWPNELSEVTGNVVTESRDAGILMMLDPYSNVVRLTNNTIVNCGGSAVEVRRFEGRQRGTATVSNNIGYGSGKWGLEITPGEVVALSCNDWFLNKRGSVTGATAGETDFSVDPEFCYDGESPVALAPTSPLLAAPGCGRIGAKGPCGVTAVLVSWLSAEATAEGVSIRWELNGHDRSLEVWIERAESVEGPWRRVETDRSMVGSFTLDLDRTAEPGRVYWYRLAWSTAVEEGRSAPIEARVAEIERVGLRAIGPNPTRGDVEIQYALGTRSSVDLTIHDVMGREVASLASGPQAGGVHIVHWASTQSGRRVRPGVYFVRLRWTGGQESRRVIVRP